MKTQSLMEAAGLLGVNKTTLQTWLAQGCPAVERADQKAGKPWRIHLGEVMQWRIERAVADAVAPYNGEGDRTTREEADRRRAIAVARMAEIDLDERLRQVVHVADVTDDMATFCQMIRHSAQNTFHKIAARCATMTNPHEIYGMCEREWTRAFHAARVELDRKWGLRLKGAPVDPDPDPDVG